MKNIITDIGIKNTVKIFQNVAYQILYGNYIIDKFRRINKVIEYTKLTASHPCLKDLYHWDVKYYRITNTECNSIIHFLNNNLEIICIVETIPEGKGFE